MTKLTSAGHTVTLNPVTSGAAYKKGTLVLPPLATATSRRTSPNPGPDGAMHLTTPKLATSVTTGLVQGKPPMETVVAPG
jgi:hypothetical protein